MAPPFLKSEYDDRLARVRGAMATRGRLKLGRKVRLPIGMRPVYKEQLSL